MNCVSRSSHSCNIACHHRSVDALPVYRSVEHVAENCCQCGLERKTLVDRICKGILSKKAAAGSFAIGGILAARDTAKSLKNTCFLSAM
ncbi:hypothetical protein FQZ97_1079310 [compost metagenome]